MAQPAAVGGSLSEYVRHLWTTFERQGIDGLLAKVPDDVQWRPVASGDRVLRGSREVRAFWASEAAAGNRERVVAYRFEQQGEAVLVSGSLRQFAPQGWSDSQPLWGFFFRDGVLRRAEGFLSRPEALAAVAAHNAAA